MTEAKTQTPPTDKRDIEVRPTSAYMATREHLGGDASQAIDKFKHYPAEIREDGLWLHFVVRTQCNGEHALLAKIARSLGLRDRGGNEPSDQYWYQVSGGHYFKGAGDVASFKRYISAFRGYFRRMEERGVIPFIETKNWGLINDYIESRRSATSSFRMGAIEGATGAQKTHCGKHYAALHNHRETIHMESPARATRTRLVHKWAEAYLVAESKSIGQKEIAIERFLKGVTVIDPDTAQAARPRCVILDNVQRLFRPGVPPDQQEIFNYFHELQDDLGFTLIFTWVPTFRKTVTASDPFWAQFLGRIGGEDEILRLDQKLPKKDLLAFAKAFAVVDDARAFDYLKRWSSTIWGVRIFMMKLEKARALATARRSKTIELAHLAEVDLETVNVTTEEEAA